MNPTPSLAADLDPIIREQLSVLERSSPGILHRLVDSFIARQSRAVQEAGGLLQRDDLSGLRMLTHSLKGSAASLGAQALAACAGEIEHQAGLGDREACARLLRDLPAQFDAAALALRAWVDG